MVVSESWKLSNASETEKTDERHQKITHGIKKHDKFVMLVISEEGNE